MNKEHPNVAVLKRFDPTNMADTVEVLAEDAVWHYFNPKLPEMHGDYLGRQGFVDFFENMASTTQGTFKVNPVSITPVGDELVVVHVKDTMVLKGSQMEIDAVVVWRILDGKIKEAWDIPAVYTANLVEH